MEEISNKYNIKYIDLYNILNSNQKAYPTKEDQKLISNKIIEEINKNLLNS